MARQLTNWFATGASIALALVAAPGCHRSTHPPGEAKTAEHDHEHGHSHDDGHEHSDPEVEEHAQHSVPTDFRKAVAQIQTHCAQIAKAIASGDFEAAHAPLDEVDAIIGQLMPVAKQSGVRRGDWEAVNVARRELRAELDKLHARIDAGERPDYAAAQSTIEDRLKRLQTVADQLDGKSPPSQVSKETPPPEKAKP